MSDLMNWTWFHKLGSPKWFYEIGARWLPWLALAAVLLLTVGLVWGLAFAPPDYQQGNSFRIIYIQVPAAFLAQ
jgi:heme exporter protein C